MMKVVLCDDCYTEYLPSFTYFPLENVKGVFRGTLEGAKMEGWTECDYGHRCPECSAAASDESGGEVLLGKAALAAVSGANDEVPQEDP